MTAPENRSLADKSYEIVRKAILTGELTADSTWSDRELCEKFDLSRTPIREAILRLQAEDLVRIVPRKGTRILPLRVQDVREIHQVTKALELEAALLVSKGHQNVEELAPIRIAVEQMEAAMDAQDREAWVKADTEFHTIVVEMCGNKRLASIYDSLRGQTDRARHFALYIREMPIQSTKEHREMYAALVARDLRQIEITYRHHWDRTTEELLALVAKFSTHSPVAV
jgi:DNA-binding GntR family transcriptional regulator